MVFFFCVAQTTWRTSFEFYFLEKFFWFFNLFFGPYPALLRGLLNSAHRVYSGQCSEGHVMLDTELGLAICKGGSLPAGPENRDSISLES